MASASASTAEASLAMKESPNWVEMPEELMINIFQRLPTLVVVIARKVCTTWQRIICKNPAMWKVIKILNLDDNFHTIKSLNDRDYCLEVLTKEAVDLSCGELIDISIKRFVSNDLLNHIGRCSKKLKRLRLVSCFRIEESVLIRAVERLPHLEKLELDETCIRAVAIRDIGRNCPQLKSFMLRNVGGWINWDNDDNALAIATSMPGLCHLKLVDSKMTNFGLQCILDGCPHLQSLHLRFCNNLHLDHGDLGKVCMERIKDFKHKPLYTLEDFSAGHTFDDFFEIDFYED